MVRTERLRDLRFPIDESWSGARRPQAFCCHPEFSLRCEPHQVPQKACRRRFSAGPESLHRKRKSRRRKMSSNHFILTVPVEYKKNGSSEITYRRVGAVFENSRRETGESFLSIKLDFPVGVTELIAFQPKATDDDQVIG
ncbi:hypothetical protein [Pelagibius sp. Alg239-R121]|uniref:hypothetical protein n=1 Tax=Pelagibius sp. Alg239-R121 TaxID=2993448 RepID=UPI0024A712A5|nr:hypothetical protein [Pelagibius sp. Alg239-R121]